MICAIDCFREDSALVEHSGVHANTDFDECETTSDYMLLVADMVEVVLGQAHCLNLSQEQAESMAVGFLREALPNIEADAEMFGIRSVIEEARIEPELLSAVSQLRMVASRLQSGDCLN